MKAIEIIREIIYFDYETKRLRVKRFCNFFNCENDFLFAIFGHEVRQSNPSSLKKGSNYLIDYDIQFYPSDCTTIIFDIDDEPIALLIEIE